MAAKKKEVVETEEIDKGDSRNVLAGILKEFPKEHLNFSETIDWKSSYGSLALDYASGGVRPGLIRLCGASGGGKTACTLEIIRNIFKDVPNSKCLWVISEGRPPSLENKARCGLKFVSKAEDWLPGTIFILESNIYELFIKMVKELTLNNPENNRYIYVVDSLNGMITRNDSSRDIEENTMVAGQAVLSKKMLQSLALGTKKFGHSLILLSQITAQIKIDPYQKVANRSGDMAGGNAAIHYSDTILTFEHPNNSDFIMDNPSGRMNDSKSKPIGQNVRVMLNKTAIEASKKTIVTYPLLFGRRPSGVWREREVADSLIMFGFIVRGGAWYNFSEKIIEEAASQGITLPQKIQGIEKVYTFLQENPDVCDYFYNLLLEIMCA
jgi:hypothetical protein